MRYLLCILAVAVAGCASSRPTEHANDTDAATDELRRYESEFRPADFDQHIEDVIARPQDSTVIAEATHPKDVTQNADELVPGFRVQLLATASIDDATRRKTDIEEMFPDEWFYLTYDPPTYKLRGGNFKTRIEADRFAKRMVESGFRDAWIVPDRVFRVTPPRTPAPQKEMQK